MIKGSRITSSFYWAENKFVLILGRPKLLILVLKQAACVWCVLAGDRWKVRHYKRRMFIAS